MERQGRSRDRRSRDYHYNARSRSRSKGGYNPKGKFCYFHYSYGKKCLPGKCKKPCEWVKAEKLQPAVSGATHSAAGQSIRRNSRLFVSDKKTGMRFLVDSGADVSIIPYKGKLGTTLNDFKLYAANGKEISAYGTQILSLDLGLQRQFQWPFVIAKTNRGILGADFLNNFKLILDINRRQLIDGITNLTIKGDICSISEETFSSYRTTSNFSKLLANYPDITRPNVGIMKANHDVKHFIITKGPPVFSRARLLDPKRLNEAKQEFQFMLEHEIIRPSKSQWASPLHLVTKKDGTLRPCGDYRKLNSQTLPDRYPIPRLEDFQHILSVKMIFSRLDLFKAYYQIPIAEEEKPKTAIITPFGLYELNVMSFGLRNAPATFQRFIHEVLRGLDFTFPYLDDILVASETYEEHETHLKLVLEKLQNYGLRINIAKSILGVDQLEFLGHWITNGGSQPLPSKRICIEFCVKLQISATETFERLNKAFPNDLPKRTTVFEWHSRFKAGRISIEDDPRQGRPKFKRTDENLELEQDTGISKTTIGRIVTEDLKLKKTPAKFIPRFLTYEQKLCRLATCEDMMEMTRTDPEWKDKIITGDETWVYGYDPETKPQSAEPKKSRNKVLLVAFSDNKGIVHHEYLPAGQTVIKEMYLGILRRLREAIRKKRPEKWTNGGWILHHDNARPHTAHLMTSCLAKNGTQILLKTPYFPDIAPNDFFLFPKLKAVLKGRHFDTRDDIIEKSPLALKSIPKEAYKNCFDNWEKRWRWCVEARGDYFEKKIDWLEEAKLQFERCKQDLASAALLSYPNPALPLSLCTDASNNAIGSVLQQCENSCWKPIAFFSRKLNNAQKGITWNLFEFKKFKYMLEGREFYIFTDHKPLVYAFKQNNEKASPRRQRQLQYILQFSTDIRHISEAVTSFDYDKIAEEQNNSDELLNLRKENTSLKFKQYPLQSGKMLWCDVSTENIRPFIPEKFRIQNFHQFHDSNHPGIKARINQLKSKFIWKEIKKGVRKWSQACINCQKTKVTRHTKSQIGTFREPDERFSVIHIDLIGPLPPSNGKYYCLTCIDRYTSWMEVIPLENITSESVALAFYNNWVSRLRTPYTIVSDQGRQFTSQLFKDLAAICGTKLLHTTPYHPQSNVKWTDSLPTILLALRAAIREDTGISISQMVYGKTIKLPGEIFEKPVSRVDSSLFISNLIEYMHMVTPITTNHNVTKDIFIHKDLFKSDQVFLRINRI
ncbi:hypothetical protein LAZ67_3000207 [Cordylochernes scorpioides]|uniref:RNA-directed DNA polymerase n=1 Tax=Cordylochernes scorpioides TaxID=51811 RepID=A0ABY6K618_9ARAC|nr:hypothetical protein LAZ67_3000207 [Cordylochernes scorpioides]